MTWAKLNSTTLKLAQYDPDRRVLYVKFTSGQTVTHEDVLPGVYENLVTASDPDFYYSYYLAPEVRNVSQTRAVFKGLALFAALAGILWLSFSGVIAILQDAPPIEARHTESAAIN